MTSDSKNTAGNHSKTEGGSNRNDLQKTPDRNAPSAPVIGWTCPKCGTDIELLRDVCWICLYNPRAC